MQISFLFGHNKPLQCTNYNPLIDEQVAREWELPFTWKLIAQMPFGIPTEKVEPKAFEPLDKRVFVFK